MFNAVRRNARAKTLKAPIGGLNDKDSLVGMDSRYAVEMRNWWPGQSEMFTRKGSLTWADGFPGDVQTVFEYAGANGVNRIFGISGDSIYDITTSGDVSQTTYWGDYTVEGYFETSVKPVEYTGLSNPAMHDIVFSTPADNGVFIYLVNGVDHAVLYDGQTFEQITDTGAISITGIDTRDLVHGCAFKGRVFFVEKNSQKLWYLPPVQAGGAATALDLSSIFQRGGYIVGIYTWTIDAGQGSDDMLVVLSSNGEVIVFQGTNPADASTWAMKGLYFIGRPIGIRPCAKFGGDLLILCEQGLVPLSTALLTATIDDRATRTDKIQNTFKRLVNANQALFGFEVCVHPSEGAIILNFPNAVATGSNQYCQNTVTGAWTEFSGWDAVCFKETSQGLMFGSRGVVKKAWIGESDDGMPIISECVTAFTDLGSPATIKQISGIRLYLNGNGSPSIIYGINGDYSVQPVDGVMSYAPPSGMVWGAMLWGEMFWGGSMRPISPSWHTAGGFYRSVACSMKIQNNLSSVSWSATDFMYQQGGLI